MMSEEWRTFANYYREQINIFTVHFTLAFVVLHILNVAL